VGVPHFPCYQDPQKFYRPDEFLPERWTPGTRDVASFEKDNRGCVQPFSYGPRNCLGKNLTYAEMGLIVARLLWRFDIELVEGLGNWQAEQKSYGFWEKGPLICKLSSVKRF
jgi:cytochrome P450